ncbi:hypothetical protein MED297_05989 [Reinekea sp. MED297]|uniref:Uncharacterized protein n=2 Tax=Reinekea TaxID=230494 RepID=A4BDD2_9GAMM|nr:hypothetical protein MED297_05989 [Reinekea sp. MED297] [Reinekea blandensis MED297]
MIDEWYIGIDKDGYVSDYDYRGDAVDQEDNCYVINLNWDRFTHLSGNRFTSEVAGNFTLIKTEDGMTLEFDDASINSEDIGQKTNLNHSDLVAADCDASRSTITRADSEQKAYEKSK